LVAGQARAGRVEAKERVARKACLTGDATKGVEILADLFIDTDDATYIYNQGRCLEQNNRYEDAIGKFREYLRKAARASADEKADAEKHIADCQALLGKKEAEPVQRAPESRPVATPLPEPPRPVAAPVPESPSPTATAVVGPGAVPPPLTGVEPAAALGEHAMAAPSAAGGAGLRVGGIVVMSVGAAALIGGVITNLKYNSMVGDMQHGYDPKTDDSSKTYQTLSIAGYGVGAACLAGGAILYYLGWRAGHVSLAPVAAAGGGGAVVTGAF
jgi:hypothetical protein